MYQTQMISLNELVPANHPYRRFKQFLDLDIVSETLEDCNKVRGADGYGNVKLFLCLLLQFMEDLSDRELERYLQENNAAKWFCGFDLMDKTPDYSLFTRVRKRIGTKRLANLFNKLREQLKAQGLISEVFTFVDATHLISKANLWKERDKAIKQKYDKLNNKVLPKVAYDKDAKIGCKGKDKYWYGYKLNVSVDMQTGVINKIGVSAANKTDANGLKHVCPKQGAIYADKGYSMQPAKSITDKKGCHLAAIKRNNMKDKNVDLDKWYSKLRSPYERVFSKINKRVRYAGFAKNQFNQFMNAIALNLKTITRLKTQISLSTGG